jgi:PBSX family phage portal protein
MAAIRRRTRAIDVGPSRPIRKRTRQSPSVRTHNADVDWYMEVLKAASQSQQADDPFKHQSGSIGDLGGGMHVIEPPFNFGALMRLPRENNMLRQCLDSMVTNVEGHGWRLEYVGPEDQEESPAAQAEKVTLENLLVFPNDETTLQELRERVRCDEETLGNAYMELGRDQENRVIFVSHIPAHTVRLTNKENEAVDVVVELPREGGASKRTVRKTFRRYVQIVGTRRIFFKEFGDPRVIDPRTGQVNDELTPEEEATELCHLRLYSPGTPYGIPRWINQMPAILGSRQAELTNLDFFKENAIPAMALLVSGGQVTQESVDDIEEQFINQRGRSSFNRITVIEARGDEDAASQDGNIPSPKMEMKPLQNERQKDGLFQDYDQNNMTKVRSSFRIPPIFVGLAEEYSHATAKSSFEVAESQVFGPSRNASDDVWNRKILASYNAHFWAFRSLPPRITNHEDVIKAIETFDDVGAMTPNVAIGLANELFDLDIPVIEDQYGDIPFAITTSLVEEGFALEEISTEMAQAMQDRKDAENAREDARLEQQLLNQPQPGQPVPPGQQPPPPGQEGPPAVRQRKRPVKKGGPDSALRSRRKGGDVP